MQEKIEIAKQNGSWESLDAVEDLLIPEDLPPKLLNFNLSIFINGGAFNKY